MRKTIDYRAASRRTAVRLTALLLFVGVAGTGWPAPATSSQEAELRWKFEPGAELVYVQTMYNEMELPQGMGTSTTEMETTTRWTVQSIDDDGNATIRITTDRLRMNVGTPMGVMAVDSDDPGSAAGSPLAALAAIAGTGYTVTLDPHGEMLHLEGLDEMRTAMSQALSDPSMAAMLESSWNDETIRGGWSQSGYALPSERVSVGSTWSNTFAMPIPNFGAMSVTTEAEVRSIEGDTVEIGASGIMSMTEGSSSLAPMPMEFGDATMTSISYFDTARGVLVGTNSDVTMQMSMSMGAEQVSMQMQMQMTLELVEGG